MRDGIRLPIARKPVLATVSAATVLIVALAAAAQQPAPGSTLGHSQTAAELKLNAPIPRQLAGGHSDTFTVRCTEGQFLRVIAEQKGIDVAVSILDPAGKSLLDSDSPNALQGPESASIICPATGGYTIRVSSADASVQPGEYILRLDALRPPLPDDRLRIEAEKSAFAGAAIFQGTQDQKLSAAKLFAKAIDDWSKIGDRYEAALWGTTLGILWTNLGDAQQGMIILKQVLADQRAQGDRAGEAATLTAIGDNDAALGQLPASLDDYTQALPIFRAIGDRANEAVTLKDIGADYRDMGQKSKALDYFAQALAIEHDQKNYAEEADTLLGIGAIHAEQGDPRTALGFYTQALPLERAAKDRDGEANALNRMGMVNADMGEVQKALELYQQALPIVRATHNRGQEASTLSNIGRVYGLWGQQQKALDYTLQALAIKRTLPDRSAEGITLNNVGMIYHDLGDNQKALENYQQALPILRQAHQRDTEGIALGNIGRAESDLGQKEKALDFYNQAVAVLQEVGDNRSAAIDLLEIGVVYFDLDQKQKALEMYQQALPMLRAAADRVDEATCLMRIGIVYNHTNQPALALQYFNQALPITLETGRRVGEAAALNNLGNTYEDLGEKQKALDYWRRTLVIERDIGERFGESNTLLNMGRVTNSLGDSATALSNLLGALALARGLKDPNMEGMVSSELLIYFRGHSQPDAAIFFGMDAVRCYQQVRGNIAGLAKELRSGYVQSKSGTYRDLAELLIQAGRLAEAEQILDLLKAAELSESVVGSATTVAAAALAPASPALLSEVDAQAAKALALIDVANPAEGDAALAQSFQTLEPAFARERSADSSSALSTALASLGPGVIGIYTLVGKDRTYLIVTTAHGLTRRDVAAGAAALDQHITPLRTALRSPSIDPDSALRTLHHLLIGPIAADIAAAAKASPDRIPTLLWSLDGSLRYVPLNALYDGKHYFVETARNVVITPESQAHLDEPSMPSAPRELAMGISRSYDGLPALSGVTAELDAVVQDPAAPASHGPIPGRLFPNDAFTLAALEANLQQRFPIVHIASHFVFKPGDSGASYLLLSGDKTGGAGYQLTLLKLDTDPQLSFSGTRLVTLSACSTAASDTGANGREMDSLGMVMQQRGAAAVLATLWDVNDASTARLMADFYRRWATTPGIQKVEALRQAQLAMLHNSSAVHTATGRGTTVQSISPGASFAHPYYWAPFVLIGNFR